MIFTKHHISLIRIGRKTQTRRFKRPRIKVSNTYSINTQFYKKENLGRVRITSLHRKAPGNVTVSDAKKLGYPSKTAYLASLAEIHREKLDLRRKIWVIEFEFCA